MEFIYRTGVFFLWTGALCLLLFFLSSVAESANMNLLIAGFLLIVIGMLLWFNKPREKPKSNRFRLIRSRKSKSKKKDPSRLGNRDSAEPYRSQKK